MIIIESKKKKLERILHEHPGAEVRDVTSKAEDELVKLSPFYPHGDIPVPFSGGIKTLYHFTDRQNIESIIKHGGLLFMA